MSLTRRRFFQAVAASTAGAVAFTGCTAPGSVNEFRLASHVRAPEDLANAEDNWYATLCPRCDAGLGVIVRVVGGRAKKLEGNPDYPVNEGKLSAQGQAAVQELYHPDRIAGPLRRSGPRFTGPLEPITWNEATAELVSHLRPLEGDQAGTALFMTGPLHGHEALLVDQFARGIGAERATLEPLERKASVREAARRVFGLDQIPEFDIANARYVLSFGADYLSTWLSPVHYSRAFGEFRHGRPGIPGAPGTRRGADVSHRGGCGQVGGREEPGTEGILALSIANALVASGKADPTGLGALGGAQAFAAYQPEQTAQTTGVPSETVEAIASDLASLRPSLVLGGDSAAAHTNGMANLVAVYSLNVLLGNIGAVGGVIPNPSPPLAAIPPPANTRFADWQRLADAMRAGQVALALVHGANPVYSLPTLGLPDALAKVPFVASFSSFLDETTALADLVLPNHHPLEDWGVDVPEPGPGFATVGFQQPVVAPFQNTRSFSDLLLVVASELGGTVKQQLPWSSLKDLVQQAAAQLQALGGGSVPGGSPEEYWTRLLQQGGWWDPRKKGELPPSVGRSAPITVPQPTFEGSPEDYPYYLHVYPSAALDDGQFAHLPWLQGLPDPMTTVVWATWVELAPDTAAKLGVSEGDRVTVESPVGSLVVPVYVYPAIRPDVVAMPLGQGHTSYTQYASGRGVNPLTILAPSVDAETGSHAWSATRVRLRKTALPQGRIPKAEGMVKPFIPETIPMIQGR